AERRADGERIGFEDRMGERHQFDIERTEIKAMAERDNVHRHLRFNARFDKLAAYHGCCERRCINGTAQARPKTHHRAYMVFMRMGEHDPEEFSPPLVAEGWVRHDEIDTRCAVIAEGDTQIDDDPAAILF